MDFWNRYDEGTLGLLDLRSESPWAAWKYSFEDAQDFLKHLFEIIWDFLKDHFESIQYFLDDHFDYILVPVALPLAIVITAYIYTRLHGLDNRHVKPTDTTSTNKASSPQPEAQEAGDDDVSYIEYIVPVEHPELVITCIFDQQPNSPEKDDDPSFLSAQDAYVIPIPARDSYEEHVEVVSSPPPQPKVYSKQRNPRRDEDRENALHEKLYGTLSRAKKLWFLSAPKSSSKKSVDSPVIVVDKPEEDKFVSQSRSRTPYPLRGELGTIQEEDEDEEYEEWQGGEIDPATLDRAPSRLSWHDDDDDERIGFRSDDHEDFGYDDDQTDEHGTELSPVLEEEEEEDGDLVFRYESEDGQYDERDLLKIVEVDDGDATNPYSIDCRETMSSIAKFLNIASDASSLKVLYNLARLGPRIEHVGVKLGLGILESGNYKDKGPGYIPSQAMKEAHGEFLKKVAGIYWSNLEREFSISTFSGEEIYNMRWFTGWHMAVANNWSKGKTSQVKPEFKTYAQVQKKEEMRRQEEQRESEEIKRRQRRLKHEKEEAQHRYVCTFPDLRDVEKGTGSIRRVEPNSEVVRDIEQEMCVANIQLIMHNQEAVEALNEDSDFTPEEKISNRVMASLDTAHVVQEAIATFILHNKEVSTGTKATEPTGG